MLVLIHQGAWPWMNSFVVDAARGNPGWRLERGGPAAATRGPGRARRPAGASEQQTIAALYLLASLVQFAAFVVVLRAIFPGALQEQSIGLLVFVLIPFNHSIHHYREFRSSWPARRSS